MTKTQEIKPIGTLSSNILERLHGHYLLQLEDGTIYHETYELIEIPYNEGDQYHQVSSGEEGRLDLISYKYYNTPLLDWVIMLANPDIAHPIKDIVSGITLRIPQQDYVYSYVLRG